MLSIARKRLEVDCTSQALESLAGALHSEFPLIIHGIREEYLRRLLGEAQGRELPPLLPDEQSPLLGADFCLSSPGALLYYRVARGDGALEAGYVSREGAPGGFGRFCDQIREWAAGQGAQGDWMPMDSAAPQLAELDQGAISLEATGAQTKAAALLEDRVPRELLERILASENVLLNTLASSFDAEILERLCGSFVDLGLIARDYVVLCRKSGQQILRVASRSSIEETSQKGFKCFICGNPLSEEQIDELLAGTEAGHHILDHQRWLTLRLAAILRDLGLDESHLRVHPGRGGFFLCFVSFQGHLSLVGFSGRPVSLEDAYLLSAHLSAGTITRCAVISTEPVPALMRRYLAGEHPGTAFTFIEGLDEARAKLGALLRSTEEAVVKEVLEGVDSLTPLALEPLLAGRFAALPQPPVPERPARKNKKEKGRRREPEALPPEPEEPAVAPVSEAAPDEADTFLQEVLPE